MSSHARRVLSETGIVFFLSLCLSVCLSVCPSPPKHRKGIEQKLMYRVAQKVWHHCFVLKATTENETTSVAKHFKKVTTGNNLFIVSFIV